MISNSRFQEKKHPMPGAPSWPVFNGTLDLRTTSTEGTWKMKQWEYRTIHIATIVERPNEITFLDSIGREGWEMCGVIRDVVVFKRPAVRDQR